VKIGYPCINRSIGCTANSTFRLASYSPNNFLTKVANNLNCLEQVLEYNIKNGIFFFRIGSDLVPFASHPVLKIDWAKHFKKRFQQIGYYIKKHKIRISMHPDQFVLLNSPRKIVVKRSVKELEYHCRVLDLMELDTTAKIQIHIGGIYGNKEKSLERFVTEYEALPTPIKERLVIENDHIAYSLRDCLAIHKRVGIPVLFDTFHHQCLNNRESVYEAIRLAQKTWQKKDGLLMVDYSSQQPRMKRGTHAEHINIRHFQRFIAATIAKGLDFDIMLEIKDKERSALKAIKVLLKYQLS
jgi:UV DNA damage endonuclease